MKENWHCENTSICALCRGEYCCQCNGCTASPEDFNRDSREMKKALLSGDYSIILFGISKGFRAFVQRGNYTTFNLNEIIRNPNMALVIKARNVNRPIVDFFHTSDIEGPCKMWSLEKGCKLSYDKRPKFGRSLIPDIFGECRDYYDTDGRAGLENQIVKEWKENSFYQPMLFDYAKELIDCNWPLYRMIGFRL